MTTTHIYHPYVAAESNGGDWFVYRGEVAESYACSEREAKALARKWNRAGR